MLPYFWKTSRGERFRLIIGGSAFIGLLSLVKACFSRNSIHHFSIVLASLAITSSLVATFVLLRLPPDTRFFTWINAILFFNGFFLILLLPLAGVFTLAVVLIIFDWNNKIARVPVMSVIPKIYPSEEIVYYWKSRAERNGQVSVNFSTSGLCGNSLPPCTMHNQFESDRVRKNLIR